MSNKKIIIFSHESDIDGIGNLVLAKLAFDNYDYVLLPNVDALEITFREYFESGKLNKYDQIYVTDLALYDPALTMIANSPLKDRIHIFDHHHRTIVDKMNRYPFTVVSEENAKSCGTALFYQYLIENNLLRRTPVLDDFVEMTRLEDNWLWKDKGEYGIKAHDLAILFNVIGIDNYVLRMSNKLYNNMESNFFFDSEEEKIINSKKQEYNKILSQIMKDAEYFTDEFNNRYGIVYSKYEYRNELTEYIINNGNPYDIKYLIIVSFDKGENGQKSYRKIADNFNVGEIAILHGGGGHIGSGMVNITEEQKSKVLTLSKKDGLKYLAESKYNKG